MRKTLSCRVQNLMRLTQDEAQAALDARDPLTAGYRT